MVEDYLQLGSLLYIMVLYYSHILSAFRLISQINDSLANLGYLITDDGDDNLLASGIGNGSAPFAKCSFFYMSIIFFVPSSS